MVNEMVAQLKQQHFLSLDSQSIIYRFSNFLCLLVSICSQLSEYVKNGHFLSYDVKFLHFIAENGTISSKFSVHKIGNVQILCTVGRTDRILGNSILVTSWYVLKCGMVNFGVNGPWG